MKTLNWLCALLAALIVGGTHAQPSQDVNGEVRGRVEQWAPGARVIIVNGRTYALSRELQVMDQHTALLTINAVRPGSEVLLLIAGGEVSHVVVNPGTGPVMDQPIR